MEKFKKIGGAILIALAMLALAAAYSYLPLNSIKGGVVKFNSPDETAAYFFARTFATTGRISVDEPLLAENGNHIHPRSMTSVHGALVPVGFLGIPIIYGSIGRILGVGILPFITPLLAMVASLFFYQLIKRLFDKRVALLSTLLLVTHPAFWYNASRSMLPNIPFVSFFIIGLTLLVIAHDKKEHDDKGKTKALIINCLIAALGGLAAGASLTIRFSEVIWVSGLLVLFAIAAFRRLQWRLILAFIAGFALPMVGFFMANQAVYGNALAGGYGISASSGFTSQFVVAGNLVTSGKVGEIWNLIWSLPTNLHTYFGFLLPFGYKPKDVVQNGTDYLVIMFWWYILPLGVGLLFACVEGLKCIIKKRMPGVLVYAIVASIISIWLTVFYGSWVFYDNISKEVTLGNSYIRYWLPIYIMAMPLIAYGLIKLADKKGVVAKGVLTAIVACMVIYSVQTTLWTNKESLFPTAISTYNNHELSNKITSLTPSDAIIVSARSDKAFFPERKVAVSYDFTEIPLITPAITSGRVYYYGPWNQKDLPNVNRLQFNPKKLQLVFVAQIDERSYLYHAEALP